MIILSSTNEELAIRIQNGEKKLYNQLWKNNYKLLYLMANRFYNSNTERCISCGVELEDIQQTCYFALCAAVGAYNQESEYKFITYINYSFKNAVAALFGGGQRKQITNPLNISLSLDVPLSEDAETTRADLLVDNEALQAFENTEEYIYNKELNIALKNAIQTACGSNEADVLQRIYWNNQTVAEIAQQKNITKSKVHSIHTRSLVMLRSGKARKHLEPFREFIISRAYKGVGLSSFRSSGISSVERIAEQWDESSGA